jgi:hypothetical protein
MTISEADQTLYKRIRDLAWERDAQRALDEVAGICRDQTVPASERFARLAPLVRERDKDSFRIFDTPRRSSAVRCLMMMRSQELVADDEMQAFSPALQQRTRFE